MSLRCFRALFGLLLGNFEQTESASALPGPQHTLLVCDFFYFDTLLIEGLYQYLPCESDYLEVQWNRGSNSFAWSKVSLTACELISHVAGVCFRK